MGVLYESLKRVLTHAFFHPLYRKLSHVIASFLSFLSVSLSLLLSCSLSLALSLSLSLSVSSCLSISASQSILWSFPTHWLSLILSLSLEKPNSLFVSPAGVWFTLTWTKYIGSRFHPFTGANNSFSSHTHTPTPTHTHTHTAPDVSETSSVCSFRSCLWWGQSSWVSNVTSRLG